MLQTIINFLFPKILLEKYTTALHAWDVDTCINCVKSGNGEQKKQMQEQWNLFYNTNK